MINNGQTCDTHDGGYYWYYMILLTYEDVMVSNVGQTMP